MSDLDERAGLADILDARKEHLEALHTQWPEIAWEEWLDSDGFQHFGGDVFNVDVVPLDRAFPPRCNAYWGIVDASDTTPLRALRTLRDVLLRVGEQGKKLA